MTILLALALAGALLYSRVLWVRERAVRVERDALRTRNAELLARVRSAAEAPGDPVKDGFKGRFCCTPDFKVNPDLAQELAERERRASPMLKALRREMREAEGARRRN